MATGEGGVWQIGLPREAIPKQGVECKGERRVKGQEGRRRSQAERAKPRLQPEKRLILNHLGGGGKDCAFYVKQHICTLLIL